MFTAYNKCYIFIYLFSVIYASIKLHVVTKVLLCGYPECFANIPIKLWKVLRSLFVWLVGYANIKWTFHFIILHWMFSERSETSSNI